MKIFLLFLFLFFVIPAFAEESAPPLPTGEMQNVLTEVTLDYLDMLDVMSEYWKDKVIHESLEKAMHQESFEKTVQILQTNCPKTNYLAMETQRLNSRIQKKYRPFGNHEFSGTRDLNYFLDDLNDLVSYYSDLVNFACSDNIDPSRIKPTYDIVSELFVATGLIFIVRGMHDEEGSKKVTQKLYNLFSAEIEEYKKNNTHPVYLATLMLMFDSADPKKRAELEAAWREEK